MVTYGLVKMGCQGVCVPLPVEGEREGGGGLPGLRQRTAQS